MIVPPAARRAAAGILAVSTFAFLVSPGWAQGGSARPAAPPSSDFGGEKAVTQPSRDAVMGFPFSTEVQEVKVKGGDRVTKGQLLVRARDGALVAAVDLARLTAESDLDIKAAEVDAHIAEIEFNAAKEVLQKGGGSQQEYDRAAAALDSKRLALAITELNRKQRVAQLRQREEELARYSLLAPFDGVVDSVTVDEGQTIAESKQAVRVVSLDPLYIDAAIPTDQTLTLKTKKGDAAWVLLPLPGEPRVVRATVTELGAVASGDSNTRRVRVEVPNPEGLPAGLMAWVRMTEPSEPWRRFVAEPAPAPAAGAGDGMGVPIAALPGVGRVDSSEEANP